MNTINKLINLTLVATLAMTAACAKSSSPFGNGQPGQVSFTDCIDTSRMYTQIVTGNLGGSDEVQIALYNDAAGGVDAAGILNITSTRALGIGTYNDPNFGTLSSSDTPLVACVKSGGPGQNSSAGFDISLVGFDNFGRQVKIDIGYNAAYGTQDQIIGTSIEGALHFTFAMGTPQQQSMDLISTQ